MSATASESGWHLAAPHSLAHLKETLIKNELEAGTEAWWSQWLKENGAQLLLFARQYTSNQEDAEEVMQQAVIRFWRSGRFVQENPKGYLYTCVRSSAIDRIRSEKRRSEREKKVGQEKPLDHWFEDRLESDERQRHLQQALERLPQEQREVLVMKIWGEFTFAEIAETLASSINTVASRYRYALKAMKNHLDKEVLL